MSVVKPLLDSLLWDIYGKQQKQEHDILENQQQHQTTIAETDYTNKYNKFKHDQWSVHQLEQLNVRKLIDYCAILKVEIRLMAFILERILIQRDRQQRHQNVLCGFVDAILHVLSEQSKQLM